MSWPKDLLAITDLTPAQVADLFTLVKDMKAHPEKYTESCKGKALGMLFKKPSTRTRISFEMAIYQLGGTSLMFRPDELQLGKSESLSDTAKVMSRFIHAMMIRTFAHKEVEDFGKYSTIPTINGLTDYLHPCQGLTDYFTMTEKFGDLKGLKVTYVGDGNNVAHSLMYGAVKTGAHITIATPKGFEPKPEVTELAMKLAPETGAKVTLVNDPVEGVKGANVVYTDVWASMGQEAEAKERERIFSGFQINMELLKHAAPNWIFMHCLPAHRGSEVTDDVCDHPQSVIFDQAENRLHTQKGILYNLLLKK